MQHALSECSTCCNIEQFLAGWTGATGASGPPGPNGTAGVYNKNKSNIFDK